MKRRLNYTNRRALSSDNIIIHLQEEQEDLAPKFYAQINIPKEWKLNPKAKIYIEAYVASTSMRFPFGCVGEIIHPIDTRLSDIDIGNVLFRAKIVDESGDIGKLLASADELHAANQPDSSDDLRSFFPLVMADLDQEIWNVNVSKNECPRLLLNNQIPGLKEQLLTDPLLQGAILPFAMKEVLDRLFLSEEFEDAPWVYDWKTFVEDLSGDTFPAEDEELEGDEAAAIIKKAVAEFINRKRFGHHAKMQTKGILDDQ